MCVPEKNKSILVVTSTFPRWADDTDPPFVMDLCERLVKENINIDVLAPHAPGTSKREVMNGVNVYRYQYFFSKWELLAYGGGIIAKLRKNKLFYFLVPFFFISQIRSLLRLLKTNKYDLIHAHWLIPQGLIAVLVKKYLYKDCPKLLCTSHGSDLFSFQSLFFYKIQKWVLNNSDGVTVVSEHMRKVCMQMTDIEEKIYVCSMGVDLVNRFIPIEDINREDNKILFVGRLVEEKGVPILLDAIHKVIQKFPGLKLVIIGDGPEREKLEAQCIGLNIEHVVEFLGALNQNQLPALYSSASIVVMTSKREGLGLVAIEAMGCGCAVVATCLPAVEDIIENGVNGVLVKYGDSIELANAIETLLVNTGIKNNIVSRARQSVIKRFDWQIVANKYKNIIERHL
jgi:glycosyltransferase involved in cell wall biosynthesis